MTNQVHEHNYLPCLWPPELERKALKSHKPSQSSVHGLKLYAHSCTQLWHCGMVQFVIVQYGTVWYSCMVWDGVAGNDTVVMVQYGIVYNRTVWYDTVHYGLV